MRARPVRELRACLSTTEHFRAVREAFEPIPVDELVVEHYGEVLAAARSAVSTTKASDLLIIPVLPGIGSFAARFC